MMYNPDLLIATRYKLYLNILKDYMDFEVRKSKKEIFIPNLGDSIPANQTKYFFQKKDTLIAKTEVYLDSNRVKSYQYQQMIKLNGERVKDILKEKDMVYSPTTITTTAFGTRLKKTDTFLITNIYYEFKYNLGNPFDRINIIQFRRKE